MRLIAKYDDYQDRMSGNTNNFRTNYYELVSYTHLTLPTICSV